MPGGGAGAAGSGKFERPVAKTSYILKKLWRYLYEFKWQLFLALFLCIGSNVLALIGPKLSGYAIDAIKPGGGQVNFTVVFHYAILMMIFYVASAILGYMLSALMIKLSCKVVNRLRRDAFNKLTTLPVGFFDKRQTGDVISVISYDIDTINTSLSNDVPQMLTSIITVVVSLVMMLTISYKLMIVFLLTVPMTIIYTRYRAKKVRPLYRKRSEKLGAMNGFAEEAIGGLKTARAYSRENIFVSRFEKKNKEAVDANYDADVFASMTGPVVMFFSNLSLALISILGAILYMGGTITLGNISSFVLYSRKFSGPINEFANIISELQSALAAAERVLRIIDEDPEPADDPNAVELRDVKGNVELRDVTFSYDPGRTIINNLNLSAPEGSVIAIVGPTGAGKTTIINLLMRFYDVDSGTITIDGLDIRNATRSSLRLAYTMVLQDTWLFHGTIFENIAYGKDGATLEDVMNAAKIAKIHNYIMALPDGYDTLLSDDGVNISKGQKQLLTLARAVLLDSRILILDEATSNVDTQTERRIQDAMLQLMKGRTCFVIAHRLSTIQNADQILVVSNGSVVEQGTHSELLSSGGYYSELYYAQFEAY